VTDSPETQLSAADAIDGGELRLPRPPGVIRRFWARHPVAADTVLAVVVGFFAVSGAIRIGEFVAVPAWRTVIAIALALVGVAGIYVRRTRPMATIALSCASIVTLVWSPTEPVLAPAVFAVYSVAVYRSTRAGSAAAGALWAASVLAVTLSEVVVQPGVPINADDARHVTVSGAEAVLSFATGFAILLALALAIGANVGNRQRYLTALIDRARQLAVERDQQGQLAAVAERARIAREMHDIVSHSLTVMVALAEGSAVAAGQAAPDAATAMRAVADTGRGAMVDMRRMLGVLGGDSDAATAPQPSLADLPELIDRFRTLGVPVSFRNDGPERLDPALQLTVYRLVQESLTNALRYSKGPTEVLVAVTHRGGLLTVTVTDDGLGGVADPRAKQIGSGRGLVGLRERVTLIGGSMTAGPRADGPGWRVQATLLLGDRTDDDNR
jgi:signal transduction histidine kinase